MTLAVRARAVVPGQLIELAPGVAPDAPDAPCVPLLVEATSRFAGLVALFVHDPEGDWAGLVILDESTDLAVRP